MLDLIVIINQLQVNAIKVMTAAKRPQLIGENKPSFLLSPEENEQLFRLIGNRCKVIQIMLGIRCKVFNIPTYIFFVEYCISSSSGSLLKPTKLCAMEQASLRNFVLHKGQCEEVLFLPDILFGEAGTAVGTRAVQLI